MTKEQANKIVINILNDVLGWKIDKRVDIDRLDSVAVALQTQVNLLNIPCVDRMEESLKWWNELPRWKKVKYADDEAWTTVELISNESIKIIFDLKTEY